MHYCSNCATPAPDSVLFNVMNNASIETLTALLVAQYKIAMVSIYCILLECGITNAKLLSTVPLLLESRLRTRNI